MTGPRRAILAGMAVGVVNYNMGIMPRKGISLRTSFEKRGLHLVFCLGLLLSPAFAAGEKAAAQQPPGAQASPAPSSDTHLSTARALVVASGMSRSFSIIIPQFMDQIGTALTQTRPELIRDLNTVLADLKPEFDKQADEMVEIAAQIYVKQMSEPDLKAAVAFFESPAGKKYVDTQPTYLTDVVTAMQGWQSKISSDMMARVRLEMKKKGHEI